MLGSLQNERILVVGGGGFIGSHVVQRALSLGMKVTIISRSQVKQAQASNINCYYVDVTNKTLLMEAIGGFKFDFVVNCSGSIDHTLFRSGGRKSFDNHFITVLNLLEVIDTSEIKRFVNIGSSDEYGDSPAPQVESQREKPISPYATGKAAATHFLQMLASTESFPATILRLFLTYGPGQNKQRFIPQVISGCLQDHYFPTSSGEQLRDFCYIDDVVEAIFSSLINSKVNGEVINIASGQPVEIRSVVSMISDLVGSGSPQFGAIAYRPGENMKLYADTTKAKSILDWKSKVSLQEGLYKTIQSMR